jgi:integrase
MHPRDQSTGDPASSTGPTDGQHWGPAHQHATEPNSDRDPNTAGSSATLNPRTDWDNWKKLLKAAGVRDGRLHDARHTAATVLLLLGVHERTIMSFLGWSTTAMVSRYAHVVAPIHSDVANRLDVLLWSSPNSERDDRNIAR